VTTLAAPLLLHAEEATGVGGSTLEQRLDEAWRELHGDGAASCPVCGGRMALAGDAGSCAGCGSELR
jgi:hypothetical protein